MNYRTLIKIKVVLYALFLCISFALAQNNENTSAFNKYMSPEGGINPMSGTVALQKDVASISAGQIKTNLSLKYSGNVFREATRSNDEVKGGIVGLGWSMGRAKIVCDCKKNSFLDDDTYYLVTADGTRYKIFEEKAWRKQFNVDYDPNAKERWWVEGNPFWKVEPVIGDTVLPDVGGMVWKYIKGWNITDAEGVVHTYGDTLEVNSLTGPKANATEYDLVWLQYKDKNGLSQPAFGLMEDTYGGEPSYYPIAWNLSRETALDGSSLVYSYEQIIERLSGVFYWENKEKKTLWNPDEGYTKETYLKEVRSSNNARIKLFYDEKGKDKFWGEFLDDEGEDEDLSDSGSDMFKERFERKFLSYIETYGPSEKDSGEYLGKVVFCYTPLQEGTPFVKRLLSAVRFYNKNDIQVDFEEYSYYDNVNASKISNTESAPFPLGALYKVNGKDCGWVEYTYEYESMGNGHVEELPLDSIYGQGYLEDGTHYLVGKKDESLKIYTRILGRWVLTDLKEDVDGTMQDVPAASRVDFGDAGWFMAVKKNSVAKIFQWNGREWQRVKTQDFETTEFSPFVFSGYKQEAVLAGPDYALFYRIDDESGAGGNDGIIDLTVFWTKWGGVPKNERIRYVDDDKEENFKIVPQKNHILLQYQMGDWFCSGNCLKYRVYTFRNDSLKESNTDDDSNLDSENDIRLNGSFLADVGEGYSWLDDSRVIIKNWNGHEWVKQIKYLFSNSDPANVEASGSDYFAVRYLDGRHLRVFASENNSWNGEALHDKLFNYDLLDDFHWEGKGSEDFFVTTRSYRNKWYQDVQHNKQIKLYYHKNGNPWQSIDYGRLKNYEGDKKVMVVGKDSFTWNQDGSNSVNAGVNMSLWYGGANINFGVGYNYNSYSGSAISTHAGVCFGAAGVACAGVDFGYSASWDSYGNFMGLSVYAQLYGDAFMGFVHASGGYERGLFGAESRGLYAGGTFVGLHGEVSQRDGGSWGFEEQIYLGYGNNMGRAKFDDHGDIVRMELWLPSLGRFGHITFGNQYDVSPEGSGAAQDAYFEDNINDVEKGIVLKRDITKDGRKLYSDKMVAEIHKQMMANGYSVKIEKAHTFWNHHEGDKYIYYKDGSRGNVEIIKIDGNNSYASYNYGNYWWTHFIIDFMGYHLRK